MKSCKFFRISFNFLLAALLIGSGVAAAQEPEPKPSQAMKTQAAKVPTENRYQYWTTHWALKEIDLRTLSTRMKLIGFDSPVEIDGTASVNFDISIPVNGLTNTRAYRFRGSLIAQDVKLDGATFPELSATVVYEDGIIRLNDFRGRGQSGTFSGSAQASINPRGSFEADLDVQQLKLGPLVALFGKLSDQADLRSVTGIANGSVKVAGAVDRLNDFTSWNAEGNLSVNDFSVGESARYSIDVNTFSLRDQILQIPRLTVTSPDHPTFYLRGQGELRLDSTQQFDIAVQANDMPTADVLGLYFPAGSDMANGKLDLKGTVRGELLSARTLAPDIDANLMIASPEFRVFGLNLGLVEHRLRLTSDRFDLTPLFAGDDNSKREIELINARYSIDRERIKLDEVNASVFGGQLKATGTIARAEAGVHRIDAEWQGIEPSVDLPLPWLTKRLRVTASTSGSIHWSVPANQIDFPAFHQGTASIKVNPLRVDGENLGSLSADLQIDDRQFELRANGDVLGGSIALTSEATLEPTLHWSDVPDMMLGGKLIIEQLSIGDAIRIFSGTENRRFAGRLGGHFDVQRGRNSTQWQSALTLRDLSVDRQLISHQLKAKLSQQDGNIQVESIDGSYAGGQVQATGQWALGAGRRLINVRLSRAHGRLLMLPLSESADQWFDGLVSGRATIVGSGDGRFDQLRMVGSARVAGGDVFGVPVGDAHSPFRVNVSTGPLRWKAEFPKVRATLARGAVHGSLQVSSHFAGEGIDLDSRWRLTHVDFEDLLSTYIGADTIGRGDVTGDVSLAGRRIRSANDFNGRFNLKLGGTDATAVPGLSTAGSTLGALSLSGVRFTSGQAKGQISRGAVQIEQLVMVSDRMKVEANGRVFLSGPRMDVRGVISTGNFQGQEILRSQLAPVALTSLSPVTSLSQWLSDRTFVVDVHGTVRDPQIRLLAAETIQTNVRRRLFRQALGLAMVDVALIGD